MSNLYLVGLPGAGKTTVGRIVARRRVPLYESVADAYVTNNRSLHSCIGRALARLEEKGLLPKEN